MPATDLTTPFDFRIDKLSQKVQEVRDRSARMRDNTMDDAMSVVESNIGRQDVDRAEMSLQGLAEELEVQQLAAHSFDPARVADLIADPFED